MSTTAVCFVSGNWHRQSQFAGFDDASDFHLRIWIGSDFGANPPSCWRAGFREIREAIHSPVHPELAGGIVAYGVEGMSRDFEGDQRSVGGNIITCCHS